MRYKKKGGQLIYIMIAILRSMHILLQEKSIFDRRSGGEEGGL